MIRVSRGKGLVGEFCAYLGRQGSLTHFLDWIAGLLIGPLPQPAWAGAGAWRHGGLNTLGGPLLMSGHTGGSPNLGGPAPAAGTTPHNDSPGHSTKECADARYHGMHGRPCKFLKTGSDKQCPTGTVLGWFWKYKTKAGDIFYVDCCGTKIAETPQELKKKPWCNWSKEQNWCLGAGSNAYVCTLAATSIQADATKNRVTRVLV